MPSWVAGFRGGYFESWTRWNEWGARKGRQVCISTLVDLLHDSCKPMENAMLDRLEIRVSLGRTLLSVVTPPTRSTALFILTTLPGNSMAVTCGQSREWSSANLGRD